MEHRYVAPATLARMLDKAHAEGVAVLGVANHPSKPGLLGAHVSSSRPGQPPYVVWLYGAEAGCDCPGYEKHGYCKHWALVLDRAGLLPEDPEPEPPAPASASPDPWAPPVDIVSRRQAAAADLARRQAQPAAEVAPAYIPRSTYAGEVHRIASMQAMAAGATPRQAEHAGKVAVWELDRLPRAERAAAEAAHNAAHHAARSAAVAATEAAGARRRDARGRFTPSAA